MRLLLTHTVAGSFLPEVPSDFPDKTLFGFFFPFSQLQRVTFRQMFDEQMVQQPAEVPTCLL